MRFKSVKYSLRHLLFLSSLIGFFSISYLSNFAYDDFNYKFIYNETTISHNRVISIQDVLVSQYHHYFVHSGRVLIHTIVQFFLMFDNKVWFDLFNTFVFGLFQIVLSLLAYKKRVFDLSISQYLLLIISLWFVLPGHNYCMFWLSGSINYLWSTTAGLFLIYAHQQVAPRQSLTTFYFVQLFLLGLILNATHEVLSIAVSVAFFVYLIVNFNNLHRGVLSLSFGAFVSTLITASSPANFRLAVVSTASNRPQLNEIIASNDSHLMILLVAISGFLILVALLAYLYFYRKEQFIRNLRENYLLLIVVCVSICFAYVVNAFNQRAIFSAVAFALVVMLRILDQNRTTLEHKGVKVVLSVLLLCLVVEFAKIIPEVKANKEAFLILEDELKRSDSSSTLFAAPVLIKNRFVCYTGLGNQNRLWLSNEGLSRLYGKEYLVFLQKEVVEKLNSFDPNSGNKLIFFPNKRLLFVAINKSIEKKILMGQMRLDVKFIGPRNENVVINVPNVCSTDTNSYLFFTTNEMISLDLLGKSQLILDSSVIKLTIFSN